MKDNINALRRPFFTAMAFLLAMSGVLPAILGANAYAATQQVLDRSIQISNSNVGATGVSYKVTFTARQAAQSLVIDFCQDSPIIGATCTPDNGVSVTGATFTNGNLPGTWSTFSAAGSTVKISGTTNLTPSTSYNFTINGVANPTGTATTPGATGSFYGRIYTYADSAYGAGTPYAGPTSLGNFVDYGGFAMATTQAISITATVMETITFCVSGLVDPGTGLAAPSTCALTSAPAVTLGEGTPQTIDSAKVYDNSSTVNTGDTPTFMVLSTNAVKGAAINMKSSYASCSGLSRDAGTSCDIPGQSSNLVPGTAGFGMKVIDGTGTVGTIMGANSYNDTTFYMGDTTQTYGDLIANTNNTVCSNVVSQLVFGATAAVTTPAGVYTNNETLIATGTF